MLRTHRVVVLLVAVVAGRADNRVARHSIVVFGSLGLASKLNVVVRKLANLDIVDSENLLLLGGAEPEGRDPGAQEAKSTQDDAGTAERVGAASDRVGDLVAKLDPVVVKPATVNLSGAVEVSNVVTEVLLKLSMPL